MRRRGASAAAALGLLLAFGLSAPAAAQDPVRVRTFVQPAQGINDTTPIDLVIQIEGQGSPQATPPDMSGLVNLSVISGPQQSSSFVWRNGKSSSEFKLIYTLLPDKPGPATIPALRVGVQGKSYTTEPIRLKIAASAPGGRPTPRPQSPRDSRSSSGDRFDIFLRAEVATETAWVGQTVPLTVTLFTAHRVSSPVWRDRPDFATFWVEDVEVSPDVERRQVRLDNRIYTAYPFERKLLIPPGPGEFEFDPYSVQLQVRLSRADPFDLFSLGRTQTVVRKSEPIELTVKPLPAGAPDDFSGAVGQFTINAGLDHEQAAVNDAVSLRVAIKGEGSLQSVAPPRLEGTPDLKVFAPQVTQSQDVTGGKMRSTKIWEWILVPLAPGDLELPPLHFSYFDPVAAAYRTLDADALRLAVQRGDGRTDVARSPSEIQLQRRDLVYRKPARGALREAQPRAQETALFVALALMPFGFVPLVVVLGRQRHRLQRDQGLARARRARSRARKRFQGLRKRLEQADAAEFHQEVARALVEYVADRFNRSPAGLTYEVADDLLLGKSVETELRRRFRSVLETCDFARFVPASAKAERRNEVLDDAMQVVEELERAW
ncbi:MAG: protein BatD [bacterium]|nr:protein BatD [bacterium]